ncbi:LamG domain-containing protein [Flavobacterium sp. I3-2]|uniref:LamG domain-containing protein n=1 Tax=Flavobacterium sp. I3-2 TaxID=2748319 RepID=UPI0015AFEECC|nr:LamG domain-containing protein [Flavobacterium sp. I3-2]
MKMNFKILSLATLFVSAILIFSCQNDDNTNTQNPSTNCLPTNLQNGVIAAYSFSNGSLNDSSGNNYHLSNPTSAFSDADRAGNPNCAFHFKKANGDFLTRANPLFLNDFGTQPFSISLWYKCNNPNPTTSEWEKLISRDIGEFCPAIFGQWSVSLIDLRRPVFGINERNIIFNLSNTEISQWRHLVVTSLGNDLKMYLDGVQSTVPITSGGCNPGTTHMPSNVGDLFLGIDYEGLLDDIIIYNRVLSQSEVIQLANLAPCCM